MTPFFTFLSDGFSVKVFVETVGCPSVILSENPKARMKVSICCFYKFSCVHGDRVFGDVDFE